jgi:hypothetical protein
LLGYVTDSPIAASDRVPVEAGSARVEVLLAKDGFQQARFTRAVRSEYGEKLAGTHVEREVIPQHAVTEAERRVGEAQDRFGGVAMDAVWGHRHEESASVIAVIFVVIQLT